MVLKQLGMASVSIQAGVEGFLELEPNSNTCFLSGRTVLCVIITVIKCMIYIIYVIYYTSGIAIIFRIYVGKTARSSQKT